MKKTLLIILFATVCFASKAQQLINGNFEASTYNSKTNAYSFDNWTGVSSVSVNMTGNTTNSANLAATISPIYTGAFCQIYDKNNIKCLQWSQGTISSYSLSNQFITQSLALTQMPTALSGNYQFTSTSSAYNGLVIATGNVDGTQFNDTLKLTSNAIGQIINLNIGVNTTPCLQMLYNEGCSCMLQYDLCSSNRNTMQIRLQACGNCPSATGAITENTSLLVDNLSVSYVDPTGLGKSNPTNFMVYPNPAQSTIFVDGKVEIYDLKGKSLLLGEDAINISGLEKGIYLVKNEAGSTTKLVKE